MQPDPTAGEAAQFHALDHEESGEAAGAQTARAIVPRLRQAIANIPPPPPSYTQPFLRGAAVATGMSLWNPMLYALGEFTAWSTGGERCAVPILKSWSPAPPVAGIATAAAAAIIAGATTGEWTPSGRAKLDQRCAMLAALLATSVTGAMAAANLFGGDLENHCATGFIAGLVSAAAAGVGSVAGSISLILAYVDA